MLCNHGDLDLCNHGDGDLCNHGDFVSFYTPEFKVVMLAWRQRSLYHGD